MLVEGGVPPFCPDASPTGFLKGDAVTLFTGSVLGRSGTLTIRIQATIRPVEGVVGTWTILGGTGELADLHGQGSVTAGPALPVVIVDYSGQVHFDPAE